MSFQVVGQKNVNRSDHVWLKKDVDAGGNIGVITIFKCVLCGATTSSRPPNYPTPGDWLPQYYDLPLDKKERALCPEARN